MENSKEEIWERAPELHHYTNWAGLYGIYTSNTIRATHYTELNDWSEIEHFKEYLTSAVGKRIKQEIIAQKRSSFALSQDVSKRGGALEVGNDVARRTVNAIYQITFQGLKGPPFCEPFISSFCNHTKDHPYEQKNGLLSQWAWYGRDERYALVFDTKKLWEALQSDVDYHAFSSGRFDEVVYATEDLNFEKKYSQLIDDVTEQALHLLADNLRDVWLAHIYEEFTVSSALFKHHAFKDEREVRIFAAPHTRAMEDYLRKTQPTKFKPFTKPLKAINPSTEKQKQHISLFDAPKPPRLPIKRIIVGPNPDQEKCVRKVEELVGNRIKVHPSETPFRG